MRRNKMVLALVVAAVIGGGWLAQAISQPRPEGNRPGGGAQPGGDRRGGDMRSRMEEFRQRMADRMREDLGATEDEWKILQPRIEKVQTLQRDSRGGFRGAFGGRGRGPGDDRGRGPGDDRRPPDAAPDQQQQPDVEKKTEALRNLLDDQASSAQTIKAALDALRKAREKAALELATAQKELSEVVTMRQEARLVLMGILE